MPFSEEQLEEMQYDKNKLRGYFWHVAMLARRRAALARNRKVIPSEWHETEAANKRFSEHIFDSLEELVESCYIERK